jgi:DNA-binding response OmpR family regulator
MAPAQQSILVVEDDKVTRETVGTVLEEQGYRVILASNGSDGLLAFSADKPDLVLTDVNMPGIDGFEVLIRVRAGHPDLPVIIITADHTRDAEREAQRLGADDFINKPVDLEDMLARIAACLDKRWKRTPPAPPFKVPVPAG